MRKGFKIKMESISQTESEDELFALNAKEDDTLLKDSSKPYIENDSKISGKAWGRVKKIFSRSKDYPYSIFFILGNEFCERFAYYGMRAILVIYLTKWLKFGENTATSVFHAFVMLCYFTPLLGAIIADGYIGKFKTIFYVSIIYTLGSVVMAATAVPPPEWIGPMMGLILIGLGTGGIKPCVGPLGADQFRPEQEKERNTFFSAFYFMINMGSLMSMLLTPVLRADVKCYNDSCYPLAFGVPAVLMFIATVILAVGKNRYKLVPPTGNLIGRISRLILLGLKGKFRRRKSDGEKEHWLYYADGHFDVAFIEDVRILLKVLFMFLPLPLFWALFGQQGSRWTLQADKMNGNVGVFGTLKPDQMSALNALLILVFIPLFEKMIYPCLDHYHIPNRPLQRMVAGMFMCAVSFVIAAFLQMKIESVTELSLQSSESGLSVVNTLDCPIIVHLRDTFNVGSLQVSSIQRIPSDVYTVKVSGPCVSGPKQHSISHSIDLKEKESYRLFISQNASLTTLKMVLDRRKTTKYGNALLSIFLKTDEIHSNNLSAIKLSSTKISSPKNDVIFSKENLTRLAFSVITPGECNLLWRGSQNSSWQNLNHSITMETGGIYTLYMADVNSSRIIVKLLTNVLNNAISMLWQVPQYVTMTIGEILFSVTTLAFSYSQAPKSMKSVVQAAWLMTTGVGSLIVVIVAEVRFFTSQVSEFLFFAGLMAVDTIIFIIMTIFYKYYYTSGHGDEVEDTSSLVKGEECEDIPLADNSHHRHRDTKQD